MRSRLPRSSAVLVVLSLLLSACGLPGASGQASPSVQKIKLKSAYSAVSVSQLPVYVAREMGLFERQGLDVDLTYIATGTTLTAAMLGGEVHVAVIAEDGVISADLRGADLVMIAAGPERLLFSLYTSPGIRSIGDLKSKKLGVSRTGSATDLAGRYILARNDLTPQKDVVIVQVGGVPEILAAMKSGAVDAGILSPPTTFAAQKAGMHELVDISEENLPFYQGAVSVRKSWLKDNREAARRYLKAFIEAVRVIHQEPDRVATVLAKYTQQTDPAILSQSVSALTRVLPIDQTPRLDAIKTGLEQVGLTDPKARDADPGQFIDASVVRGL